MRHLRICIGETLNRLVGLRHTNVDYYIIDTYADRTLGLVFCCSDKMIRKIKRELETKYGVWIKESYSYKSQYGRGGTMHILHCTIVEEADERGF